MQVNHHLLEGRALELPYSEARVKTGLKLELNLLSPSPTLTSSQ